MVERNNTVDVIQLVSRESIAVLELVTNNDTVDSDIGLCTFLERTRNLNTLHNDVFVYIILVNIDNRDSSGSFTLSNSNCANLVCRRFDFVHAIVNIHNAGNARKDVTRNKRTVGGQEDKHRSRAVFYPNVLAVSIGNRYIVEQINYISLGH